MIRAYIDTGGLHPIVRQLESQGLLRTCHFPFENRNSRVTELVPGSGATWAQSEHVTWASDPGSWDDDNPSAIFDQILRLVGGQRVDAQHLDSAFKARCVLFITSDKGDIWVRRDAIFMMTGRTVLHMPSQLHELERKCSPYF
jgi:hypothetical protein